MQWQRTGHVDWCWSPTLASWWFGTLYIVPYIRHDEPNWRTHIFQRGKYTTNQSEIYDIITQIDMNIYIYIEFDGGFREGKTKQNWPRKLECLPGLPRETGILSHHDMMLEGYFVLLFFRCVFFYVSLFLCFSAFLCFPCFFASLLCFSSLLLCFSTSLFFCCCFCAFPCFF